MTLTQQRVRSVDRNGIQILELFTYFDGEALGAEAERLVHSFLEKGQTSIIMDFTGCPVINSSGLGVLMKLGTKIVDDFQGRLLLVGLNELQKNVLEVSGVSLFAEVFPTVQEAQASLSS